MGARKNVSGFFVGRVLLAKADLVEQEEVKESCQNAPLYVIASRVRCGEAISRNDGKQKD